MSSKEAFPSTPSKDMSSNMYIDPNSGYQKTNYIGMDPKTNAPLVPIRVAKEVQEYENKR